MAFAWNDSLSVGVEEIDKQHKELIRRVNNLMEAVIQGKGKDKLDNLIVFLENYTKTHFADEEKWMIDTKYPGYTEQLRKHLEFIEALAKLKVQIKKGDSSTNTVATIQQYLCDWLVFHIGKMDKEMGVFLQSNKKTERASIH